MCCNSGSKASDNYLDPSSQVNVSNQRFAERQDTRHSGSESRSLRQNTGIPSMNRRYLGTINESKHDQSQSYQQVESGRGRSSQERIGASNGSHSQMSDGAIESVPQRFLNNMSQKSLTSHNTPGYLNDNSAKLSTKQRKQSLNSGKRSKSKKSIKNSKTNSLSPSQKGSNKHTQSNDTSLQAYREQVVARLNKINTSGSNLSQQFTSHQNLQYEPVPPVAQIQAAADREAAHLQTFDQLNDEI